MTTSRLKILLLLSRVVVGFCLFGTFTSSCQLLGLTFDTLTGNTEVRVRPDTTGPNLFSAAYGAKAGFEDGFEDEAHNRPSRLHQPLLPIRANTLGFELAADPQTPFLRYKEPSAWKRLVLLYLGASDSPYSLSWLLFLGIGSWQLWQLLRDVAPATPFTRANSRRLARLALLVLSLGLAQTVSYLAIRSLLPVFHAPGLAEPLSHYVQLSTENALPGYLVGIMLAIIAAGYRRGVELSQEAELVI